MGEQPPKDEFVFDPWRPVIIAGKEYRPAVPRTPNFFEQQRINQQVVAKLLGGRAIKDHDPLDIDPPRGIMTDDEERDYYETRYGAEL